MFKHSVLCAAIATALFSMQAQAAPEISAQRIDYTTAVSSNSWLEINLTQFQKNIDDVKAKVQSDTKICAIMKADAYGNGIAGLMPTILDNDIPCIGVTSNSELSLVREKGFTGSLARVRSAPISEIEKTIALDVEELVGDIDHASQLGELAKKYNKTIKVHLALNHGGMSRNGTDSIEEAVQIAQVPGLEVVGIMTHFPSYDRQDVLTKAKAFEKDALAIIKQAKLKREDVTIHAANSFVTLNVPEAHFDMVRPGGVLYGDQPTNPEFLPIFSFKTKIASLMDFPKDATVGYDSTVKLTRDSVLANLPVGYSDSYPRKMGNNADVLINGQRAKVKGVISMNTTMIDVTDIDGVKPGDEVVLFGVQKKEAILGSEWEKHADVILPEIYTQWGQTNDKVYVN